MNATCKVKLEAIAPSLTCLLCRGYLIDATTIIECMHSFCKTCIVKHLEKSNVCPYCKVQLHISKPLTSIRSDQMLQEFVYKLVPGLFQREMGRRREHYGRAEANPANHFDSGQVYNQTYISSEDLVHLSLEHLSFDKGSLEQTKRFVKCQAAVSIRVLRKFIVGKYDLNTKDAEVQILYGERVLPEDFLLMDVAYKYSWNQNGAPLELFYRIKGDITQKVPGTQQKPPLKRRMSKTSLKAATIELNGKFQEFPCSLPAKKSRVSSAAITKPPGNKVKPSKVSPQVAKTESIQREVQLSISETGEMVATNGQEKIIKSTGKKTAEPTNHLTPKLPPVNHLITSPTDLRRNLKLNELSSPKLQKKINGFVKNGYQLPALFKTAQKRKSPTLDETKTLDVTKSIVGGKTIDGTKATDETKTLDTAKEKGGNASKSRKLNSMLNGSTNVNDRGGVVKKNGVLNGKVNGKIPKNWPQLEGLFKKAETSPKGKSKPSVVKGDFRFSPNSIKTKSASLSKEESPKKAPKFFKSRHVGGEESEESSSPSKKASNDLNALNGHEKKDDGTCGAQEKVLPNSPNWIPPMAPTFAPPTFTTTTNQPFIQYPIFNQNFGPFCGFQNLFQSFQLKGPFLSLPTESDEFINSQSPNGNASVVANKPATIKIPDLRNVNFPRSIKILDMSGRTNNGPEKSGSQKVSESPWKGQKASESLGKGQKVSESPGKGQNVSEAEGKTSEVNKIVSKPPNEPNGHGSKNGRLDDLTLKKILKKSLIENGSLKNGVVGGEIPFVNGTEKPKGNPEKSLENHKKSVSLEELAEETSLNPPFESLHLNNNEISRKPEKSPSKIDAANCNNNCNDVSSA